METTQRHKSTAAQPAAVIVLRDLILFLTLLAALAVLYRVSPGLLCGKGRTAPSASAAVQASAPEATTAPAQAAVVLGSVPASVPISDPAVLPTPTPAPTPEPLSPAERAAASGDFSAAFPSYDTGTASQLSYQSDTLRVAIDKVQENGVTYFVADVWIRRIDTFLTAFAKGEYGRSIHEMPLKIANANRAVFAVSGDYYGARDKGVVIRNGKLYRDVMGDDVCVLRRDGTLSCYGAGEYSALAADDAVWQAWAFGPALMKDGAVCDTSHSNIKVKNPRCGVGCYEPGHYCFIVVDGRQDGYSSGMTLDELARAFQRLGVTDAYNLDGGATAQMVFQGQVVNRQTKGGRAVSDILCFSEG